MSYPITDIEGIDGDVAATLKSVGIRSTERLLETARTVKGRKALAEKTGFAEKQLLCWANVADRMRIKGISKEYAELLQAAGVDTVKELKYRNPANLAKAMADANKQAQNGPPAAVREGGVPLDRERQETAAQDHLLRLSGRLTAPARPRKATAMGLARTITNTRRNRPEIGAGRAFRAVQARPSAGHGHPQRHPGFLLRRRPVPRSDNGPSPMPARWPIRAPTSSTSARNPRAPMAAPSRCRPTTRWRGSRRCCRRRSNSACRCRSTPSRPSVAAWALDQGAAIVNDVWGLQRDPDMARLVAERGVPVIVMHNREAPTKAIDIVADVIAFFSRSLEIAERAGIAREKIVLDPGIGFGKTPEQSIVCIARLAEFKRFGLPLLVGASRKRFINSVTPSPPDERIGGSIASHLLAVKNGAAIVRAHDVAETVQALRVAAAIEAAR